MARERGLCSSTPVGTGPSARTPLCSAKCQEQVFKESSEMMGWRSEAEPAGTGPGEADAGLLLPSRRFLGLTLVLLSTFALPPTPQRACGTCLHLLGQKSLRPCPAGAPVPAVPVPWPADLPQAQPDGPTECLPGRLPRQRDPAPPCRTRTQREREGTWQGATRQFSAKLRD